MAYAKRGKKPAIACAVVLGGHTVINELMELRKKNNTQLKKGLRFLNLQ